MMDELDELFWSSPEVPWSLFGSRPPGLPFFFLFAAATFFNFSVAFAAAAAAATAFCFDSRSIVSSFDAISVGGVASKLLISPGEEKSDVELSPLLVCVV